MANRTNRTVSKHTRRMTLEDSQGLGRLNVKNMNPNYHYFVENDDAGMIEYRKNLGCEVVEYGMGETMGDANEKEVGTAITTTADRKTGKKAILMRQPKEFYEEDVAFQQRQITESEKAMYRQAENEKGRYGGFEKDTEE